MIVVDASVVVLALSEQRSAARARARLRAERPVAPDHLDVEVASALRGLWLSGQIRDDGLARSIGDLAQLSILRYASRPLLPAALEMRANLTVYDATYVALAAGLGCPLITLDRRLAAGAVGWCEVEVLE